MPTSQQCCQKASREASRINHGTSASLHTAFEYRPPKIGAFGATWGRGASGQAGPFL